MSAATLQSVQEACERLGIEPTPRLLVASVADQRLAEYRQLAGWDFVEEQRLVISTSRFGVGQAEHSNNTPLGLHRITEKIGGDSPNGSVFESREIIGTVAELPGAPIAHRILWLDGLEPGFNRGGGVDTHDRYVYIHGVGDESTIGQPASRGCIHLAAADLLPFYDRTPSGTLLWIAEGPFG
ncbi:MAG: hypothetical protein CMO43_00150 [Verrucomicrobiales bacterium]|jgi:lipoprotein-anchoring transpeptidase ErfK/SrfK|nr:hypothetical protein [Verrucomicrobiales bacterium]MDP6795368.1 L,D-transpeptidase [Verrucomicrobiota bacterium]